MGAENETRRPRRSRWPLPARVAFFPFGALPAVLTRNTGETVLARRAGLASPPCGQKFMSGMGLIMIFVSLLFCTKKWLQTILFFVKKLCDYRKNCYLAKNYILEIIAIGPSTTQCSLLCLLYGTLLPLRRYVSSTALCPLYGPLSTP